MNLITTIIGAIFGGTDVASSIANAGKSVALVALVPALWHWTQGHGAETAVSFTWMQLACAAGFVYAIVQVAHKG